LLVSRQRESAAWVATFWLERASDEYR
jgi:hypothetical protein